MSVIARTMRLLDVLEAAGGPVSLTDLALATELPLTTVHRLCGELLDEGIVERGETGGFGIGSRLWVLGRRYERAERLRTAAARFLRDLHEVTRAQVDLVLRVGGELIVVERITMDPGAARWHARAERLSPEGSAAGLAIIAAEHRRPVPASVQAVVDDARATGVVRLHGGDGGAVLAAAVTGAGGVEGAVVLHTPDDRAARAAHASLLVTARRISSVLGISTVLTG